MYNNHFYNEEYTYIVKNPYEKIKEIEEIEEYKTKYTERCIDKEVRNKINELVRAVNKLNKEREEN